MIGARVILLIIACVLLVLAALDVRAPRVHLGWLGLALWLLGVILG